jgi:hypothetical protein
MNNRAVLLGCLDIAMLLLVCVLEPIKLTGLEWHQWLGFALCPLVLLHVVLQWPWFAAQFKHLARHVGCRIRLSAVLNLVLFGLMAAVLVSGVLSSRQSTAIIGESVGRVRLWHEIHGWLNVVLVVFVALHLALNWDWMVAFVRRARFHSAVTEPAGSKPGATSLMQYLGRAVIMLLVASLVAVATYFTMKATLSPEKRADLQDRHVITVKVDRSQKAQLAPAPRRPEISDGLQGLAGTVLIVLLIAMVGRYVFRLRL